MRTPDASAAAAGRLASPDPLPILRGMEPEPSLLQVDEMEFATRVAAVDFQERCEDLLEREGRDLWVLFTNLLYVDSTFLAALLSVHHTCAERGLRLGLAGIEGRVAAILDTAKVSSVIPTGADLDELRERFAQAAPPPA